MNVFRYFFSNNHKDTPELLPAIERAIAMVEPQLKHTHRYPNAYRKPVMTALAYAHSLAHSIPGPLTVNLDSYAKESYNHAIFPSMDIVSEAFHSSRVMLEYLREHPSTNEVYALMGMRRIEKTSMGMELYGQVIQRDVPRQVVCFTSHTIENPAPSEQQVRTLATWSFFDRLVGKVAKRVALRKQEMQTQRQEKDLLMARLRAANAQTRPALEKDLSRMLVSMQSTSRSLDLHNYLDDFKAVLLNPEQHLRLDQSPTNSDSIGIRQNSDETAQGEPIILNDPVDFDYRDWTVTIVYCRNIQSETFSARLGTAYRRLSI
jgi:hypothetical protein